MRQRKFLVFVLTGIIIASAASAQITLHSTDVDPVGTVIKLIETGNTTVNTGSAGASQSWTVPEFAWSDSSYYDFMDPATTPMAEDFPTATRAQHNVEEMEGMPVDFYSFEEVQDDAWLFLGIGYQMDTLIAAMPFETPVRQSPLPLTYGASWTNVVTTPHGPNETRVDSSLMTVDGWGTLTTPFGTYNVLRIYSHVYEIIHSTEGTTTTEVANIIWLDEHGLAVVSMQSDEETARPDFTSGSVHVRYRTTSAVEPVRGPLAQSFVVGQNYPNPFNPTTSLPVELSQTSRVTVDIYNEAGQLVSHEVRELTAGSHSLPVNGAAWSTGTYFARVSAHGQSATTKMQLLK